jgi:hypothetical protein
MREVLPQATRSLGPDEQLGHSLGRPVPFLLQPLRCRERQRQHVGEATVIGLHLANPLNKAAEAMPGIGVGQGVIDRGGGKIIAVPAGQDKNS